MKDLAIRSKVAAAALKSMKALIYEGSDTRALDVRPMPVISVPTDAIAPVTRTTICGADLVLRRMHKIKAIEAQLNSVSDVTL